MCSISILQQPLLRSTQLLSLSSSHPSFISPFFNKTPIFSTNTLSLRFTHPPSKFHTYIAAKRMSRLKDEDFATSADLQFEPPLKIVEYPDPMLRANNKRIDKFDDHLKKLIDEMFDVMYRTDGIGLSAPQVGINVQLMVFNAAGERGEGEEIVLVNPRVTKYSQKTTIFNEGCLSFPRLYADVKRPESVQVDARDITGSRFSLNLSGLPARVFQHEFDHLQGTLFFERMTEEVLDTIREGLQALEVKYEKFTGLPSPEKVDTRNRRPTAVGFGRS